MKLGFFVLLFSSLLLLGCAVAPVEKAVETPKEKIQPVVEAPVVAPVVETKPAAAEQKPVAIPDLGLSDNFNQSIGDLKKLGALKIP
jgi:hypothetical protein